MNYERDFETLEIGKSYADGQTPSLAIKITHHDREDDTFLGDNGIWYKANGMFYVHDHIDSDTELHLITLLTEVEVQPDGFTDEEVQADSILRFFHYAHLPEALQPRSKPFADLARHIIDTTPRNAERSVVLRKLLEAKDAAVRAHVV